MRLVVADTSPLNYLVLIGYPGITHNDIMACLAYARDTLSSEKVFPSAA
jgi:hypothetical protein